MFFKTNIAGAVKAFFSSKPPIKKGMNKGQIAEEYTNSLAFESYLRFWCYPNPKDEEGDKKEICDLLILFERTCIIISVKNYELKGNYQRYEKKVIQKSTNQLYGAERKLFKVSRQIKIKHPDRDIEEFDSDQFENIFRITVNMGEQFEYYSLADQKENKGFISILNKQTFEHLLQELDTIPDLVKYLNAREHLLTTHYEIHLNGSESDMLAVFMLNNRSFPKECFGQHDVLELNLENAWYEYNHKNLHVKDRRDADQVSYLIDRLVERDVLNEEWGEELAKELMSFNRMNRRVIAQNFYDLIEKYGDNPEILARRHILIDDTMFLLIKYSNGLDPDFKDRIIRDAGNIYFYKLDIQNKLIVLGAPPDLSESKYAILTRNGDTSQEAKDILEDLCQQYGWFQNMNRTEVEYKEFPNEE
jgi:hypothetical protein